MKKDKNKICLDCGVVLKESKVVKSYFTLPKLVIECCNCGCKRVLG